MAWSRNTSWRQGSVLAQKDFQVVDSINVSDIDLAIAISHDCDIANDDLDVEPAVEFIFARILEQHDGNYTYGKNPRILHLDYKHNGQTIWVELRASRRFIVQKNLLDTIQPDQTYSFNTHQNLQRWLSVRYRRHALPNSLVERLRPIFAYIDKEGKKNSAGIFSFRLFYDPKDELPPEEAYELSLSIVYITDKDEYRAMSEEIAQRLKEEFPKLLAKTKDQGTVDLRKCEAFSEMEFTVRDMRDTVEYNLEHLSYRDDLSEPVI
jgi:hypothetical protein